MVNHAPDNPVAHYNLGRAHTLRQEWEQSRQEFQKALESAPDYLLARLELAKLEVARGDFDAALKATQTVLQMDRNNNTAKLIQSAALMGQKKFGDSRALLDAMLKTSPNSPDVLFQLGVVNLSQAKYKEADEAFKRAYELNPANPRGLMGMVETAMAQNKRGGGARSAAGRIRQSAQPSGSQAGPGQHRGAVGQVRSGDPVFPQRAGFAGQERQGARGRLSAHRRNLPAQGRLEQRHCQPAEGARNPAGKRGGAGHPGVGAGRGRRWTEAKQVYEAVLKLDPNNAVALNNLAFLMAEHNGDLDDALSKAQRAKQLLPDMTEVSDTLGWIFLKKNLSDSAIDTFRELVNKAPNQSTYRYHLGMALYQKGDKLKAIKELQDALKYNPPPTERQKIQEYLARLQ